MEKEVVKGMEEVIEGCWEHEVGKRWGMGEVVEGVRRVVKEEKGRGENLI